MTFQEAVKTLLLAKNQDEVHGGWAMILADSFDRDDRRILSDLALKLIDLYRGEE